MYQNMLGFGLPRGKRGGAKSRLPGWTECRPCPAPASLDTVCHLDVFEKHVGLDWGNTVLAQLGSDSEQPNSTVQQLPTVDTTCAGTPVDTSCAVTAPPLPPLCVKSSRRRRVKRDDR